MDPGARHHGAIPPAPRSLGAKVYMIRPRALRPAALALLLTISWSCAEEPTAALQLVLTPDPSLGSTEEILAQLETIQLVVDAPGGIWGAERSGPLDGGGTAEDWDEDGELEARFELPAPAGGELPVLELGLSQNSDRELTLYALGFAAGTALSRQEAAAAGAATASCPPGEQRKVGIPFNLKASHRPPRVVLVLPPEGTAEELPELGAVTAVLSTTVDPDSLADRARVLAENGAAVPTSLGTETLIAATGGGAQESRSMLSLSFGEPLTEGSYQIEIGPGILSTVGRLFDQDPSTPELEGFTSGFSLGPPSVGGGLPCESCPPGYGCEEGVAGCVPLLRCDVGCEAGFVCDGAQGLCVEDCRVLGLCADPAIACDQDTGRCR